MFRRHVQTIFNHFGAISTGLSDRTAAHIEQKQYLCRSLGRPLGGDKDKSPT